MRILQTKTYSRDLTAMHTPLPLTADAPALAGALKSRGYLKIHCPAQVAAALHRVFVEADAFFALPLPVKDRASLVDLFEGYRRLGSEYCESADRPDLAQSFWTHAFNLEEGRRRLDRFARPLYDSMQSAAALLDEIVSHLVLEFERHYWGSSADRPQFRTDMGSHLQLNYYNPPIHQRDLLLDCHEDGLLFTILQSTAPGLEILGSDGAFAPIGTDPDELLIMPGDIAMLLSGGEIAPLYHRVNNRPDVPKRMSLMYFSNPNADPNRWIKPWREDDANRGVDIMRRAIENPLKFGLPPIPIVDQHG